MAKLIFLLLLVSLLAYTSSAALLPQQQLLPTHITHAAATSTPLPLIIWHGLGDNYKAEGLRSVGTIANATNPGTYTYFIRLDHDPSSDRSATFFGNLTLQIQQVCDDLASHPVLSKAPAVNALGFSQGGQFLRAYIERCNKPRVANLVTFGAQHNGISRFQKCANDDWLCKGSQGILKSNTWSHFVQSKLVPAQYYRDAEDLEAYLENSNFLADVNNERKVKNATYRENMKKVDRFAMYVFEDDVTVVPKESGWFSEVNGTTGEVTKLQDRDMYKEDWIGLRWLDEERRLEFRVVEGAHMELSKKVLVEVFERYFRPRSKGGLDRDQIEL